MAPRITPSTIWPVGLAVILLIGLVLRLHGIYDPILDHPGWRQGDTAAIARNFARLQFNIMYPQTMYNGPPPNYVELELQIVPFLAAILYKLFGIHEVFGRLISIAFGLATVAMVGYFGRWLFASTAAGLLAAFFYAVFPGSVYYGRTFMPDAAMVFFLVAALYAATRFLVEDEQLSVPDLATATGLLTLAYLAKPVAMLAIVPLLSLIWERYRARRLMLPFSLLALLALPPLLFALYDRRIASYAEWHWASGITRLHVLPALHDAFTSVAGFTGKLAQFGAALDMLRHSMLGGIAFPLVIASVVALPWIAARSKALLWGWLAGGLIYAYVVVTVERVDYYLYPLLPLSALTIAGALARFIAGVRQADVAPAARYALLGLVPLIALATVLESRSPVAAYYRYNATVYRNATLLDRTLPKDALVVIGHYGPDVQYYINRFGWEEDPALWTPFDEESAIRKGSRYFISIEDRRMRENLDVCAWLHRFPVLDSPGWPVYRTDPALARRDSESGWRAFRDAERGGAARRFLDALGLCNLTSR